MENAWSKREMEREGNLGAEEGVEREEMYTNNNFIVILLKHNTCYIRNSINNNWTCYIIIQAYVMKQDNVI